MRESTTYQAILEEGRAEGEARGEARGALAEARKLLVRIGSKRFGAPDERTRSAMDAIASVERLEELSERVLEAGGWEELLAKG